MALNSLGNQTPDVLTKGPLVLEILTPIHTPSISEDNKIDRDTPKLILDNLWLRRIIKIEG